MCKRLEFKNMLNRFDPATTADSSMELEFFTCNDLSGVEALFEKAAQKDQVGISVLADPDQVYTVGLVLDEKEKSIRFRWEDFSQGITFAEN